MTKFRLGLFAAIPLMALAGACATGGSPTFDEVSQAPEASLSGFDKVYVADVSVAPDLASRQPRSFSSRSGQRDRAIAPDDLSDKADDLERDLRSAIGRSRQLVDAPGPDVLTVQAEIIDLASSRPTKADMSAEPGLSFDSRYAGRSDIRIDMTNGGRTLASVRDRYDGDLSNPVRGTAIWSDADRGFDITASKVARLLDQ